jgi:hypothetical protein
VNRKRLVTGADRSLYKHNQSDPASYKISNTYAIKAIAGRLKLFIFLQFENIWFLTAMFLMQIQNSTLKSGAKEVSHSVAALRRVFRFLPRTAQRTHRYIVIISTVATAVEAT